MKPVFVIGHKNPDTDSICSAICYAELKNKLSEQEYIPCRAGRINEETAYVLQTFGVEPPRYVESLEPRISDVQIRAIEGISSHISLKRAYEIMKRLDVQTLPVLKNSHLRGILTMRDVAQFYMEDQGANALAEAGTSYRNIVDALNGELIVGEEDEHFTEGKVVVAAANPDVMEDYIDPHDMVILGNRYESQLCSIEMNAGCIVVGLGSKVSRTIQKLATEAGCKIVATPMDTYTCSKTINQAVPVRHVMKTDKILTFRLDDKVEDVVKVVSKQRVRYFPILDNSGNYVGLISQRNLMDLERQKVVLVDHNERDQAVEGIRTAEITEIIDHHRIDNVETRYPIYFRNQPLGCTATIIAMMYEENHVEISRTTAGLLCSAIVSDTLLFRSPTCTFIDRKMAEHLAGIAGIDLEAHAMAMFNAGSRLGQRTPDEIFHMDYKSFKAGDILFAVAQVSSVSQTELSRLKVPMLEYMRSLLPNSGQMILFTMLTNIIDESTELLFVGENARAYVEEAFHCEAEEESVLLQGVVSRKKQMISPLITAMENLI